LHAALLMHAQTVFPQSRSLPSSGLKAQSLPLKHCWEMLVWYKTLIKAQQFEGGSLAIFRLAPQDYHRFHIPVDGIVGPTTRIEGERT
jgi:phosphatidylserine decarboxylase